MGALIQALATAKSEAQAVKPRDSTRETKIPGRDTLAKNESKECDFNRAAGQIPGGGSQIESRRAGREMPGDSKIQEPAGDRTQAPDLWSTR
jgi:hypothetical protein